MVNTSESEATNHVVTHATITVTRSLGSNGPVSIDYATSDGTAHSSGLSVDYTPVSGTLTWADGDFSPKTFTVDILDDTANEGKEVVNLTLNNATGNAITGTTSDFIGDCAKRRILIAADSQTELKDVLRPGWRSGNRDSWRQLGTAKVYMTDPDGDGKGPIELITLAGTDSTKSTVTIKVKKLKGGTGDVLVGLGAVTGTGLKSFTAPAADLNGDGFNLTGYLGSLTVHGVQNGADIITVGGLSTQKTTFKLGVVADGTTINIANPIGTLRATSFGDGAIIAPSAASIITTGRPANVKKADPGDPGNFNADVTLSGAGVLPKKSTLGSLSVNGDMLANTINVQAGNVASIQVRGNIIGSLIETTGFVSSVSAFGFHGSRLFVGFTGADEGVGTFNPAGQLGAFTVTGKVDGFQDSYVIASSFRSRRWRASIPATAPSSSASLPMCRSAK